MDNDLRNDTVLEQPSSTTIATMITCNAKRLYRLCLLALGFTMLSV